MFKPQNYFSICIFYFPFLDYNIITFFLFPSPLQTLSYTQESNPVRLLSSCFWALLLALSLQFNCLSIKNIQKFTLNLPEVF